MKGCQCIVLEGILPFPTPLLSVLAAASQILQGTDFRHETSRKPFLPKGWVHASGKVRSKLLPKAAGMSA